MPAILRTIDECGNFLVPYFVGREIETVFLLCLDAKCKVICCKKVGEGSVNSANIPVRRIVEMALAVNATTVILAHNHPSGNIMPSSNDMKTTRSLTAALAAVDVTLQDHFIFSDSDYMSMRKAGWLELMNEDRSERLK